MGGQELAKRDKLTFKLVMKCYEQKQYKKGLKNADAILKKNKDHGETLAMKGNCA
jgi:N-alpha-acetyltransferase 15/16, NatA auxiliary subunit